MTLPIALTLLIAVVAIAAFVSGRFRLETVAVGLLLALLFLFVTVEMPDAQAQPGMVFAGFANTGLITLMALLIVARGLTETGALSRIADLINRMARHRRGVVFVFLLLIAALTSSFINNTPIVLIFIPILILVASDRLPPSRTLIPLSYASILGGMTTLVGSSTNLIAAGVAVELGLPPFDFFAFTIPGLVVAGAGLVYVTAILPWLLPKLESEAATPVESRQFVTEIEVRSDSPAVGEVSVGGMFPGLEEMTVFSVRRGLDTYLFPFEDVVLRAGDVLVVALSRTRFPSILGSLGGPFRTARIRAENEANFFAEAVVTVDSPFTRTPPMTPETFRRRTGCTILGLRRTRLTNRRNRPLEVPLQSGDMLLVEGTQSAVSDLRQTGIVVPTEWRQSQLPPVKFRWRAAGIFLGTVLAASSGVVPVVVAAVAGAFSMIASGTLSVGRALGAIDGRVAPAGGSDAGPERRHADERGGPVGGRWRGAGDGYVRVRPGGDDVGIVPGHGHHHRHPDQQCGSPALHADRHRHRPDSRGGSVPVRGHGDLRRQHVVLDPHRLPDQSARDGPRRLPGPPLPAERTAAHPDLLGHLYLVRPVVLRDLIGQARRPERPSAEPATRLAPGHASTC